MYKRILLSSLFCLTAFFLKAQVSVASADSAYLAGNYQEAIEIYQQIAQEQGVSAPLLFNLGNAYFKADDFGHAMVCYQRAKRLDPSNSKIRSNLNYLTEKVQDANKAEQKGKKKKVAEDTPNFLQSVHSAISQEHSSDNWAGWAAAFFLIFAGCVALYLFCSGVLLRKVGFFGGFVFLGLSMIFIVFAYSAAAVSEEHDYGVVIAFKTELQTEPNAATNNNSSEGILTQGTKLRIISEETDADGKVSWYKVRLNSDYIGWIQAEYLDII